MKRYANTLLLFALFIAAGCIEEKLLDSKDAESEIDQLVPGKELSIQATREGGLDGETKTTRVPSSGAVLWTPGDAISLFYGSGTAGGSRFESTATENSDVTNFTGTITAITGGANIDPADTYFWGVYPYRDDTSCDGTSITMTLPSQQTAVPGTFATDVFPSIGRSQGLVMGFYNVCGGWWFSVTKEGVRKVTIRSNGGEAIAGTVKVALNSSGIPQVTEIVDGSDEVVLECPQGEYFEVGENYYVVLLPGVLPSGFTMTFETYTEAGVYNRTKSTTITRSNFGGIPSLDTYLTTPYTQKTVEEMVPPDNEIWYTTDDSSYIDFTLNYRVTKIVDANVLSNTYEGGIGIIRCDAPITEINESAFSHSSFHRITNIFLPNSITKIEQSAFYNTTVEELRIPDNLQYVGGYAFVSENLRQFIGNQTTEDGRCIILRDGFFHRYNTFPVAQVKNCLAGFAPSGLSEYVLPSNIEVIGSNVFANCSELKSITFNEGLKTIYESILANVNLDCEIHLPSTLEWIEAYAFLGCTGIKGFYGNDKFHTADHMCLTIENYYGLGRYIIKFVGEDLTSYTIPEGIVGMEYYAFRNMTNLKTITFPSSVTDVQSQVFEGCKNLEAIYGDCASEDHRGIVFGDTFRRLLITKGITKYTVPNGIKRIGHEAFSGLSELEEVIIPDSVIELGGYDFSGCRNLKKVILSSNLNNIGITVGNYCGNLGWNPFLGTPKLEEIYFRSFIPPVYTDTQFRESDCQNLTVYVPEETLELYKNSSWNQYAPYMVGYKYDDIGEWNPD